MNYWLMKSEPTSFSIDDLQQAPKQKTCWDGVRNYQARNMIKDQMRIGDLAFFYHSNCAVPGIVGIVEICSAAYVDSTQFDVTDHHYDPRSKQDKPLWWMVDVKFKKKFDTIISLQALRDNPHLSQLLILRKGNRLSITPVTPEEWRLIAQ